MFILDTLDRYLHKISYRTVISQVPAVFWDFLSQDDKFEFTRLRTLFHQNQEKSRSAHPPPFRRDLSLIFSFLKRSPQGIEFRAIVCGICFVGSTIVLNTRELSAFLGRCRVSLTALFHEVGFFAVRTQEKVKQCILAVLPSLEGQSGLLRQWTVMYSPMPWQRTGPLASAPKASAVPESCFSLVALPRIVPSDLATEIFGMGPFVFADLDDDGFPERLASESGEFEEGWGMEKSDEFWFGGEDGWGILRSDELGFGTDDLWSPEITAVSWGSRESEQSFIRDVSPTMTSEFGLVDEAFADFTL
jgi:hypothetical protein